MVLDEFIKIGIQPKGHGKEQKVKCPECRRIGKTNPNDTCLSINTENGLYNCHKCGWKGCVIKTEYQRPEMIVTYKIPQKPNITKLTDQAVKFFEDRGINQEVLVKNKIAQTADGGSIVFPYFRSGELINYKSRSLSEKKFYQAKEAEPIMYNLDRITGQKEIICNEGEIDSLSWEVAGFENHTSVNQGAPNVNDQNIDKKLECITNCFEVFEQAETIYIGSDNDPNGLRLQKELVRRFGPDKCKLIDYKECKDANEYLIKYGSFELAQLLKTAKDVKIDGVFQAGDLYESMMDGFVNGQKRGETTHIDYVDQAWRWRTSEVNLWTGYQNEGKTLMLNQLALIKAYWSGDKFAVFSPENMPIDDFYNDLVEMYIGKTSDPHYPHLQMSEAEYKEAIAFIDKVFFIIYPEDDFTIETIFAKAQYLVRKQGIRHLIIDPYNTVEHLMRAGERDDLYISRFMSRLKKFAVSNDVSVHLVAHQLTAKKNTADNGRYFKPDLNSIKGGGTFADKADNVLFVWRPERALDFRDPMVIFGSQKIKKQKLVARPTDLDQIRFEFMENRYYFDGWCPFHEIDKHRKGGPVMIEASPFPLMDPKKAFDPPYDDVPF